MHDKYLIDLSIRMVKSLKLVYDCHANIHLALGVWEEPFRVWLKKKHVICERTSESFCAIL